LPEFQGLFAAATLGRAATRAAKITITTHHCFNCISISFAPTFAYLHCCTGLADFIRGRNAQGAQGIRS